MPIDIDQLAKLLRGANVTINVIGGTGNTVYTGPVQINHHHGAAQSLGAVRCRGCGKVLHNEINIKRGYCLTCEREQLSASPHYHIAEQHYTIEPIQRKSSEIEYANTGRDEDMPI